MKTGDTLPGFFPAGNAQPCNNMSHNPPMGLYIPPGMLYRHVCPACGYTVVMGEKPFTLATNV